MPTFFHDHYTKIKEMGRGEREGYGKGGGILLIMY